jgi:hypothetical protein
MKTYTLYWLDGKREVIQGNDIADAMTKAGYGQGAVKALDFHASGDCNDYVWNKETYDWNMTDDARKKLFGK